MINIHAIYKRKKNLVHISSKRIIDFCIIIVIVTLLLSSKMIKINKTSNKYNLKYEYEVKSIKMFLNIKK